MTVPDKKDLRTQVLQQMQEQLAVLEQAAQIAAEASTHADAKQEGKYDTRAIESSYLAGAQAERVADLKRRIQVVSRLNISSAGPDAKAAAGSLVEVSSDEGTQRWYMIVPGAAGLTAHSNGIVVTILSHDSRLGAELIGKEVGDELEGSSPGREESVWTVETIL